MKTAIVREFGAPPVYGEFEEPAAADGEVRVAVSASALTQLARSRASGKHYSSDAGLPAVAGVDGVGRLDDGRRVYFVLPRAPFGGMAEHTVVPAGNVVPVPDDLDDVTAAALANPGMSSWAALTERARLAPGETVLVNGATGTSGRLAVQIAKHLGAGRVIATGRNAAVLAELAALGADATIQLGDDLDATEQAFQAQFAGRVDVVLDYLWGASAERLLIAAAKSGADAVPIRFVQVGSVSGHSITLPSAVLRSSALELIGSGIGSVPFERMVRAAGAVLAAARQAGLRVATRAVPLADVSEAWDAPDTSSRVVFSVG